MKKIGVKSIYLFISLLLIGNGVCQYSINLPFLNEMTGRGLCAFFLGVVLFEIYSECSKRKLELISTITLAVCVILGIFRFQMFYDDIWSILVLVVWPMLIIWMLTSRVVEVVFDFKVFGMLGKASFDMYVWHVPFLLIKALLLRLLEIQLVETYFTMVIFAVVTFAFGFVTMKLNKRLETNMRC